MKSKKDIIRETAEGDLEAFIRLIHPDRMLGNIHRELIHWWNREDAKSHQLTLLPRDHQKSALNAYRVAWAITRNPAIRVLYISSTSNLAIKQLKFIKDILTCSIYRSYWPDMVNIDEGKREKWTETEISVDHPFRKSEHVRDPTVWAAGLTTSITGMHCDIAVMDDVVVDDNADTEDGRGKVRRQYSYLSSVESTGALEWLVGTRYNPKDLYSEVIERKVQQFNDFGEEVESEPLYEVFERQVEDRGDMTGEFIWPKQQRKDGKWFGFDTKELAKKKAQYLDEGAFYSQYYNDPNRVSNSGIQRDSFQYYNKAHLSRSNGSWYIQGKRLNVFAAVDFAFSLEKKADYTAIAVVGVDGNQNFYILEIARFKANLISEYFKEILILHQKWDFRKIRAEVTAAQDVIVKDLKQNYIRVHGLALSIDDYRPTRNEGTKRERIAAILRPKYDNRQIWHYQEGNCQILEDELVVAKPSHDDCKDALASCIDICVAPAFTSSQSTQGATIIYSKFGGIS